MEIFLHFTSAALIMKSIVVLVVVLYAFQVQAFRLPGLGHLRKTDNEYPTMDIWKFLTALRNQVAGFVWTDQDAMEKDRKHKHRHGHGDQTELKGMQTTNAEGNYIELNFALSHRF